MIDWDKRFLALAQHVSTWSKDPSTKTGAVIVNGRRVVSLGYNGFPQGMPDLPELYENREEKYSRVVHCEINALLFVARSVRGCTLYTWPFLSCDRCFVQMAQAGIMRFVAPQASPEQLERWSKSFERVRRYAREMCVVVQEV